MAAPALDDSEVARRLAAYLESEGNASQAAIALGRAGPGKSSTYRHWLHGWTVEKARDWLARQPSASPVPPAGPPPDPVAVQRLRDEASALRGEVTELRRQISLIEDLRAGILGVAVPLSPRAITAQPDSPACMAWVIGLFDYHVGKSFHRASVFGLMDYSVAIARARIARQFRKSAKLIADHGARVDGLIIVLGGDNANGELREDDTATNEIAPMMQARAFAEAVVEGIDFLLGQFGEVVIDVVALPGNHGRTKKLPVSVQLAENWDILSAWLIAAHYRTVDRVRVVWPEDGPDVVLDIYGRAVLVTHGDRIGSNGGDGQIGLLGPTKRGALKIASQFSSIRHHVPGMPPLGLTLMGHYHSYWTDLTVMVSGAGIGVDQWSLQKLRVPPRPPILPLLGFHPEKWLTVTAPIWVGHPDEGPICADVATAAKAAGRVAREVGI
jgi:hypothetical protein